jgi:hypothetical protein
MDIDQASNFLACAILLGTGITVLIGFVLLINNLCHRYWKPMKLPELLNPHAPIRFAEPHEMPVAKK